MPEAYNLRRGSGFTVYMERSLAPGRNSMAGGLSGGKGAQPVASRKQREEQRRGHTFPGHTSHSRGNPELIYEESTDEHSTPKISTTPASYKRI